MITSFILAIIGGIWRRLVGISAWCGFKRSYLYAGIPVILSCSFMIAGVDPILNLLTVTAICLQFPMGHEWTDFRKTLVRYSIVPFILAYVFAYYGFVLSAALCLTVGPATAGFYHVIQREPIASFLISKSWSFIDKDNKLIDGNICFGEFASGFLMFLAGSSILW